MRPWSDFISDFLAYSDDGRSPEIFRLWSAITLVGGALERRVWVHSGRGDAFPNLFVLLIAPPGVGKQIISTVRSMWRAAKVPGTKKQAFHIAPNSVTKASLLDNLNAAQTTFTPRGGKPITYSSLLVAAEEFGVLLPAYDNVFMTTLNDIWNNPEIYDESRRTGSVRELSLEFPQLTVIGGYQPGLMATVFPDEAWSSGFARRTIMVYCSEAPHMDLFYEPELEQGLYDRLLESLGRMSQLYGAMKFTKDAATFVAEWDKAGGPPAPTHSKLQHYGEVKNRTFMLLKLTVISSVARRGTFVIELNDVQRALGWLLAAEKVMPDIFRAMIGRSDTQIMEELQLFCWQEWSRLRDKVKGGIRSELIWRFLAERMPSERIEKVLMAVEKSGMLTRQAGTDLWIPRPRHETGVE